MPKKILDPVQRKMTADDKRRYYYLCEHLASEAKDNECLIDCLYRISAERRTAIEKLGMLCIEPNFRFIAR